MPRVVKFLGLFLLVASFAVPAIGQVPEPNNSYIYLDGDVPAMVRTTCPDTTEIAFWPVWVYVEDGSGNPIDGIANEDIVWSWESDCDLVMVPATPDPPPAEGHYFFWLVCETTCACTDHALEAILLTVRVLGVPIEDEETVYSNSYDADWDGDVDPVDFAYFAQWFLNQNDCADYNNDWEVDPRDFSLFAQHFTHSN